MGTRKTPSVPESARDGRKAAVLICFFQLPGFPMGDLHLERIVDDTPATEGTQPPLFLHQLRPHGLLVWKLVISLLVGDIHPRPVLRQRWRLG